MSAGAEVEWASSTDNPLAATSDGSSSAGEPKPDDDEPDMMTEADIEIGVAKVLARLGAAPTNWHQATVSF